jgi:hypothetical protein
MYIHTYTNTSIYSRRYAYTDTHTSPLHIQAVRIGEVDAEKLSGISDDDLNKVQGQKMKAYSVYKQDVAMFVPPPPLPPPLPLISPFEGL